MRCIATCHLLSYGFRIVVRANLCFALVGGSFSFRIDVRDLELMLSQ
jgi:hypothetical protein